MTPPNAPHTPETPSPLSVKDNLGKKLEDFAKLTLDRFSTDQQKKKLKQVAAFSGVGTLVLSLSFMFGYKYYLKTVSNKLTEESRGLDRSIEGFRSTVLNLIDMELSKKTYVQFKKRKKALISLLQFMSQSIPAEIELGKIEYTKKKGPMTLLASGVIYKNLNINTHPEEVLNRFIFSLESHQITETSSLQNFQNQVFTSSLTDENTLKFTLNLVINESITE